jgi:hypothetical protein
MLLKIPKETEKFSWTKHAIEKMRFYGLSEQKVKGVISRPQRTETGVAPKTTAVMQRTGSKKRPTEIWVMYQIKSQNLNLKFQNPRFKTKKLKIISAWRYPGVSPVKEVPIPEDIRSEIQNPEVSL